MFKIKGQATPIPLWMVLSILAAIIFVFLAIAWLAPKLGLSGEKQTNPSNFFPGG